MYFGNSELSAQDKKTLEQLQEIDCSSCGKVEGKKHYSKGGGVCTQCGKLCDCPTCLAPVTERYSHCRYCGSSRIVDLASCS